MMAINVMARVICPNGWHEYQDVVEVAVVVDASVAKMSGGDVDVEPYLDSRNTIGRANRNSNSQSKA